MPHVIHFPAGLVPAPSGVLIAIILLAVSLLLMFAGRSVVKSLAFLLAGVAGALAGATLGAVLFGLLGLLTGAVLGFFIVGFIGYSLLYLGVGFITGYFVYELARSLGLSLFISLFLGVVFFIVGILLTGRFLELITAIAGGAIFFSVAIYFGSPFFFSLLASIILAALGYVSQVRSKKMV